MKEQFRLIFLNRSGEPSEFTNPPTHGAKSNIPRRDREHHSARLRRNLDNAWDTAKKTAKERTAVSLPVKKGFYLEFESAFEHELVTKSLEDRKAGIRLLNVRTFSMQDDSEHTVTRATVYIPAGKEGHFLGQELWRKNMH
ncbi:MAG: hypothetical protein GY757_11725 [bacterium]|nr:hypothetical protein [bacterium]